MEWSLSINGDVYYTMPVLVVCVTSFYGWLKCYKCVPVMMGKEVGGARVKQTPRPPSADTWNIPYRSSDGVAPDVSPAVTVQAVLYVCARMLGHTCVVGVAYKRSTSCSVSYRQ